MLYGWTLFYALVTAATLVGVWRDPARGIGMMLFASVLATTFLDSLVPIEATAGVKVVVESAVMLAAMMHLWETPRRAMVIMGLSLAALVMGMGFSMERNPAAIYQYEIAANAILLAQCATLLSGYARGPLGRFNRYMRSRPVRWRLPVHRRSSVGVATPTETKRSARR